MDGVELSHILNAKIYKDEEEIDNFHKQSIKKREVIINKYIFEDCSDKEIKALYHYTQKHYTKASIEVLVKIGGTKEPIVALNNHNFEMNRISKDL